MKKWFQILYFGTNFLCHYILLMEKVDVCNSVPRLKLGIQVMILILKSTNKLLLHKYIFISTYIKRFLHCYFCINCIVYSNIHPQKTNTILLHYMFVQMCIFEL